MLGTLPRFARWASYGFVISFLITMMTGGPTQTGSPLALGNRLATSVSVSSISTAQVRAVNSQTAAVMSDPNHAPDRPHGGGRGNHEHHHRSKTISPAAGKAPNPNCTLIVPPAPLTAQGLATPYELIATIRGDGPCHEANEDQSAFVEATIIDPATGALSVYRPLVIDHGTRPAAPPIVPNLSPGSVVGVWFGFQGDTLTLHGATGGCVNGLHDSPFGQFAYCGAPEFFRAANTAISQGKLTVPPLATSRDGQLCPTTRDFSVVDQDQSDNLDTTYLALPDGRTAQDNATNVATLPVSTALSNASDNGLLNSFIDPALGCHPFTAPDLSAPGTLVPSLALNELQAAADQIPPVALVPINDPMTQVDDKPSIAKTDLYRTGVNMPSLDTAVTTASGYCRDLATVAPARLRLDRPLTIDAPSPDPATAKNLFAFLQQRLKESLTNLNCSPMGRGGD